MAHDPVEFEPERLAGPFGRNLEHVPVKTGADMRQRAGASVMACLLHFAVLHDAGDLEVVLRGEGTGDGPVVRQPYRLPAGVVETGGFRAGCSPRRNFQPRLRICVVLIRFSRSESFLLSEVR